MKFKLSHFIACITLLVIIASIANQPVIASKPYEIVERPLLLRFVDQAGQPLKKAYVEVWNETGNEILFTGRTNDEGWLNVTIPVLNTTGWPWNETTYNITVKWDPKGEDSFTVFKVKKIKAEDLVKKYNYTTGVTEGIVTSVLAVNFTARDLAGGVLKFYETTFEYNYTDKKYSVKGMPAEWIVAQIPYDVSWGSTKKWTLRVYWDYEYLKMVSFVVDGTNVTAATLFPDTTYANFTLAKPSLLGPVATLPRKYGFLNVTVEVSSLQIQLYDWLGAKLTGSTSGYSVVKAALNDKEDPSKLLATVVFDDTGYALISQFPNVSCTLTVYWLSHEIPVNSTTIVDPTDYYTTPLNVYCKLVPFNLVLKDKRPSPQTLGSAKVKITWPNLISFNTRSEYDGVVQLPPLWLDNPPSSWFWPGASGYLPFGDTVIEVYWSITPEDPASWVMVRKSTISVSGDKVGSVTVKVDGEEVTDDITDGKFDYDVSCEVYEAHLTVVDLNGNPLPLATVVLEHPTGAVSMVTASPVGSLTLVQVPGGIWRVSVVYKNLWLKPFGMSNTFNVTHNIRYAVEYKFGFVDASLKMVKWGSEDHGITGLNVTLSWSGNATITDETGTWTEDWVTTDAKGFANFTQIPVGVSVSIEAYTVHKAKISSYPHLAGKANIFVGPHEDTLILEPENYVGAHHVYIYDFKIIFCDVTGAPLPSELPYTNMTIASMTFKYGNTTKFNELVYYSINNQHVFIGGEKYEFKAYWAGVRVFNATVTVPKTTDPTVIVPETKVICSIYPVTFKLYNWKHTTMVNDYKLKLTVTWYGMNMTTMSLGDIYKKVTDITAICNAIWGTTPPTSEIAYLYNVTLITSEESSVYLPVWELYTNETKVTVNAFGLPITIYIKTIPGETKDIPETANVTLVGCLTTGGNLINITDALNNTNAVTKPQALAYGVLNFTGAIGTHWGTIWLYDEATYTFDMKVTAYDMTGLVADWLGRPYADYTVKVYWRSPLAEGGDVLLATTTTGSDGVARFPITFWGNNTKYYFEAYREPKPGEIPDAIRALFKLGSDTIATDEVVADEDGKEASLGFSYYIGVQMLSSTGRPLYHTFGGEVKKALVYAVRHTEVDGVEAGTIAAYGWTDDHGYVYLAFAKNVSGAVYTIRAIWLGVNVYDSYEKEVMYKTVRPSIFYTAFTDVYDVSFRLVDDVERALPGIKYTFVGSAPIDYKIEGTTGPDGTFTAILVPKGDYHISAVWMPGEISILDTDMTIDKNFVELPIRCKVYDAELVFSTKRGTALAAATVTVTYPDGHDETKALDREGKALFTRIPIGDITIKSITWMGRPITVDKTKVTVDKTGVFSFTATNVYLVTVKIYGARGQGLGPSTISISPVGIEVESDESGVATVELPEGSYSIHVNYKGVEDEKTVDIRADTTVDFRLDVLATILGRPFRTAEFFGELVLLPIVIAIIIYLVAYEYYAWRRRRVTVVPPSTS